MALSSSVKRNHNGGLAAAMTLLIQNQAAHVSDMRETQKEFARIRRELEEIKTILAVLTEATGDIRQMIGFKSS